MWSHSCQLSTSKEDVACDMPRAPHPQWGSWWLAVVEPHIWGVLWGTVGYFHTLWCGSQKTIYGSQFSPSAMWVQGPN